MSHGTIPVGESWRQQTQFGLVLFNTDNQNEWAWVGSIYANNELAQDLCRLISTLCVAMQHSVKALWWPTYVNTLADLISRLVDADGREIPSVREEWELENVKLDEPYRIVKGQEIDPRIHQLVDYMGGLNHAFSPMPDMPIDLEDQLRSVRASAAHQVKSLPYSVEDVILHTSEEVRDHRANDGAPPAKAGMRVHLKSIDGPERGGESDGVTDMCTTDDHTTAWVQCSHGWVRVHGNGSLDRTKFDAPHCLFEPCIYPAQHWYDHNQVVHGWQSRDRDSAQQWYE